LRPFSSRASLAQAEENVYPFAAMEQGRSSDLLLCWLASRAKSLTRFSHSERKNDDAVSIERRVKEQRAKSKEQRAKSKEQRAKR
jgi:hypothetical protein